MSRIAFSAQFFLFMEFRPMFVPFGHNDELEFLPYQNTSTCPQSPDVRDWNPLVGILEIENRNDVEVAMKVAVTGGSGFIGANIVRHLVSKGHEVFVIAHRSKPFEAEQLKCETVQCDISDFESLQKIRVKGVEVLLHLAAQSSGPKSFEFPDIDIRVNVLGTLNMINWCCENQINRILFASSFTVYGELSGREQLQEEDICDPKSVYGLSKYTSEQLLKVYATPHGINWNVLRMFNVYGPGQDLTRKDQGMVGIFLNYLRQGDYVSVKGRLDRFRDFAYIDDIVAGWEYCLMNGDHPNEVYNLATGVKTHISELIQTLIDAFGKTNIVQIKEIGSTPGDITGCYADVSKFSRDFNFEAQYSLERGIHEMVKWACLKPR